MMRCARPAARAAASLRTRAAESDRQSLLLPPPGPHPGSVRRAIAVKRTVATGPSPVTTSTERLPRLLLPEVSYVTDLPTIPLRDSPEEERISQWERKRRHILGTKHGSGHLASSLALSRALSASPPQENEHFELPSAASSPTPQHFRKSYSHESSPSPRVHQSAGRPTPAGKAATATTALIKGATASEVAGLPLGCSNVSFPDGAGAKQLSSACGIPQVRRKKFLAKSWSEPSRQVPAATPDSVNRPLSPGAVATAGFMENMRRTKGLIPPVTAPLRPCRSLSHVTISGQEDGLLRSSYSPRGDLFAGEAAGNPAVRGRQVSHNQRATEPSLEALTWDQKRSRILGTRNGSFRLSPADQVVAEAA